LTGDIVCFLSKFIMEDYTQQKICNITKRTITITLYCYITCVCNRDPTLGETSFYLFVLKQLQSSFDIYLENNEITIHLTDKCEADGITQINICLQIYSMIGFLKIRIIFIQIHVEKFAFTCTRIRYFKFFFCCFCTKNCNWGNSVGQWPVVSMFPTIG